MKSRKVQEIPKAQRQEGYGGRLKSAGNTQGAAAERVWRPKRIGNTRGAAGKRVWRPKRIGNTQGAAETRGWDTKNKYSTQTKKKNMKK